jgi:DNA-binding transcriptional LysR family regulator
MQSTDLNLLAALEALLESGSVTRAAEQLHLSAPAMSRALGRLRAATGDPLLIRAGRGLVPTPRALALRPLAASALRTARAVLSPPPSQDPATFHRRLVIRADDAVAAALGPALHAQARREAPGVTLIFTSEGTESPDALRTGDVDVDLGVQGRLAPELKRRAVADDALVALTRPMRGALTLARFVSLPHVAVSRRGLSRGPVDDALAKLGHTRTVALVVPTQLAAAAIVAQSNLVALVSALFARHIATVLPVIARACPVPTRPLKLALAWHPRFDADPPHRWLREALVSHLHAAQRGARR